MTFYNDSFYREGSEISLSSARVIVPLIMQMINPRSVVDVGCGTGEWLSVFHASGVGEILGIDGGWVPINQLHIPQTAFRQHDLSKPLKMGREFELAISLEVAEHLDHVVVRHIRDERDDVDGQPVLRREVARHVALAVPGGTEHEGTGAQGLVLYYALHVALEGT